MYSENELTATLPCAVQSIGKNNLPTQGHDLSRLVSILKYDPKWVNGEMNSMIILKNGSRSVVLSVVHEKTEIISSPVKNPVTIQVIKGQLKIHSPKKENQNLSIGETLTLNERFRIEAVKETAFVVIINTSQMDPGKEEMFRMDPGLIKEM
jgi:hypothetical protein